MRYDPDFRVEGGELERPWSLKKGFAQSWNVEICEIKDGVLLPNYNASAPEIYYPIVHPGIPCRLAAIQEGDDEAVLKFSQEYGHLGHDRLTASQRRWKRGDPLAWVRA